MSAVILADRFKGRTIIVTGAGNSQMTSAKPNNESKTSSARFLSTDTLSVH